MAELFVRWVVGTLLRVIDHQLGCERAAEPTANAKASSDGQRSLLGYHDQA